MLGVLRLSTCPPHQREVFRQCLRAILQIKDLQQHTISGSQKIGSQMISVSGWQLQVKLAFNRTDLLVFSPSADGCGLLPPGICLGPEFCPEAFHTWLVVLTILKNTRQWEGISHILSDNKTCSTPPTIHTANK